jgi:hypothetical protein
MMWKSTRCLRLSRPRPNVAVEAALIGGIESGLTYFNIHTTQFPGGELRTELLPIPAPTPVPGVGLPGLILACGVLLALARRIVSSSPERSTPS